MISVFILYIKAKVQDGLFVDKLYQTMVLAYLRS